MKVALALLLAAAPAAWAQTHPVIMGAQTMMTGFDMIKGTQNGSKLGQQLLPVYAFTYNSGKTWTDPFDQQSTFSVPDQVYLTPVDTSTELINEGIQNSYSQWITTKLSDYNVNLGIKAGNGTKALSLNFKYDHESAFYKNKTQTDDAASGFSKHEWCKYQLQSLPPELMGMVLDPGFKMMISILPDSIKSGSDQQKYNDMVTYYGTHVPYLANFGGHVHVSTFVKKSFLSTHTSSWVKNQFALTFHYYMFDISGGGFTNKSQIHISQEFKEAATTYIAYTGGDITLQNNGTLDAWVKSIPQQPHYLNVTMMDLGTLVEETSATKAALLRSVIKTYIDTGKMPSATESDAHYEAHSARVLEEAKAAEPAGRKLRGAAN